MTQSNSKRRNPLKPERNLKNYTKFVGIAILILLLMDYFLWQGERPHIAKIKADYYAEKAEKERRERESLEALLPPTVVYPDDGAPYFEAPVQEHIEEKNIEEELEIQSLVIEKELPVEEEVLPDDVMSGKPSVEESHEIPLPSLKVPNAQEHGQKMLEMTNQDKPRIAIVIDDVGMNLSQSRAAINLDPNVTLAFLPYAEKVKALSIQAKEKGHEMIIHTPMEAMNGDMDLGSLALKTNMEPQDFTAEFQKIIQSFEGYVGVNNHMGSRLTQDRQAMGQLMRLLKSHDLFFLDSKTISTSVAAEMAAFYGVPFAARNVFLDHEDSPEFVTKALKNTERIARKHGKAIAIGHPKKNTMAALRAWIPTLEGKGFELVPLSALIQKRTPVIQMVKEEPKNKVKKKFNSSRAVPVPLNFQLPE